MFHDIDYKDFDNHTSHLMDNHLHKLHLFNQLHVRIQYLYIWYTSLHHYHDIQNI